MPTYLLALIIVLIIVAIFAFLYIIFTCRRMSIAFKKIDYLIEDLTYRIELLSPALETIAKLGDYTNSLEKTTKKNSEIIFDLLTKNKPEVKNVINDFRNNLQSNKPNILVEDNNKEKDKSNKTKQ